MEKVCAAELVVAQTQMKKMDAGTEKKQKKQKKVSALSTQMLEEVAIRQAI